MPKVVKEFSPSKPSPKLARRKGGGGGGRGGSSRGSSSKGSSSKGKSSPKLTTAQTVHFASGSGLGGKVAKSYSDGGGPRVTLSNSPFSGREAGGGKRTDIYGTRRYGSGYPYGYGYGGSYYVSGYPTPYYYWPVPVRDGYYGSSTYGYHESQRPGGVTVAVPVKSTISAVNDTLYLLGDKSSTEAVMDSLTRDCHVAPAEPNWTFVDFNKPMQVQPEEVTQWYRASTFALALEGYNNSAALISNMKDERTAPPPPSADTPLPSWVNRTFLDCVNKTVGESLPLVEPPHKRKLSSGAIAGIVIGSMVGAILIFIAVVLLIDYFKKKVRFSLKWPKFRRTNKKSRGAYASVKKATKTDHDVLPTPTDSSYSEKYADSKENLILTSEKQETESFSTSLMTAIDDPDDIAKHPPKRFQQPKSTLDMGAKPMSDPAYPYSDDKHA